MPLFFFFSVCCMTGNAQQTECAITKLQTDYLKRPIGIDNQAPRLSWQMKDSRNGAKQNSYRLLVGTDSLSIKNGRGEVWDTGKINSEDRLVTYAGQKLNPFTKYYWTVIIEDANNNDITSDVQSFETGMLQMDNWQGSWIGDGRGVEYELAPYFRKEISVDKTIESARAYIAAAGLYELFINGEKIGDHRLDPMYTRFDRRNLYVTYDVTDNLKRGKNAIGVLLGNGWYNHQSKAVWEFDKAPWRNRPTFCLDLHVTYTDGTTEVIPTDLTWKTSSGALVFNSIYTAEHYDAQLEKEGWNMPHYDDSKWDKVYYRAVPSQNVTAQQVRPIRNNVAFPAKNVKKIDDKTYLFDFGQNMAGVTQIKLKGNKGTVVKIKHGERLDKASNLDLSNIDVYYLGDKEKEPFQTDILTLSGNEDEFMAKFNYKGFRYVEVSSDQPIDLDENSITAFFMHSDVPSVGQIHTSNKLINKLCKAANNSYLSNFMGFPTDCPQREKNGWTGDGHFAIEAGLYNFDGITVYEKWLADHRDEQQPNGVLPDIIPTGGWGYGTDNGLDWTSTIAIIPWNLYLFYGDEKPLIDNYESIKKYVDYVDRISVGHLTSWGRGDWVPVKSQSNKELTSSVYFFVDAQILANTAKLLNKEDDYKYYSNLVIEIKNAINEKFLNTETGIYNNGTQTELSVPLQWKVVPEDMIPLVSKNLADKVKETGFHLDVGVLGAKAILNALSENGYADVAYKVATQSTYPSWGWWIVNGATTLLENWDLLASRDISDNHMMFGEIGAWFYKGLGGIFPNPKAPGYKHIILMPYFEKSLKYFEAKFDSPYGEIVSKWKWENSKKVKYEIVVPANSSATFYLPENIKGEKIQELQSGKHVFDFTTK